MKRLSERQMALLQLLADGAFHSGEQIGERLGISRAAVSQQLKGLRQLGLEIFSVSGRGHALARPLELLDQSYLQQQVGAAPVHCVAVVDSTNDYMMGHLAEWRKGECLLAESQTAGRGRRGRQWVSPFAGQMILSLYWRLEQGLGAAMGLSLVVGVALAETLEAEGYGQIGLKWPNDLYAGGQKLAGILVEMSAIAGGSCHIVIGVGLNLAMTLQQGNTISQPWCALESIAPGRRVQRNRLIAIFIRNLRQALERFEQQGLAPFIERWDHFDIYRDQAVELLLGDERLRGIVRGIDGQGGLLLEGETGIRTFVGGEISLRPVNENINI